ncbi:MAG: hypothetical protein AB7H80_14875 [Candidatus Kapaibacterium sp.]
MADELIQFSTKRLDSFQLHHVDGLWGTWTPEGLVMNFYLNWCKEPSSVVITPEGEEYKMDENDQFAIFERVFVTGIRADMNAAIAMRDWLSEMIDVMQTSDPNIEEDKNDD